MHLWPRQVQIFFSCPQEGSGSTFCYCHMQTIDPALNYCSSPGKAQHLDWRFCHNLQQQDRHRRANSSRSCTNKVFHELACLLPVSHAWEGRALSTVGLYVQRQDWLGFLSVLSKHQNHTWQWSPASHSENTSVALHSNPRPHISFTDTLTQKVTSILFPPPTTTPSNFKAPHFKVDSCRVVCWWALLQRPCPCALHWAQH